MKCLRCFNISNMSGLILDDTDVQYNDDELCEGCMIILGRCGKLSKAIQDKCNSIIEQMNGEHAVIVTCRDLSDSVMEIERPNELLFINMPSTRMLRVIELMGGAGFDLSITKDMDEFIEDMQWLEANPI